jgi:hypothetical protein
MKSKIQTLSICLLIAIGSLSVDAQNNVSISSISLALATDFPSSAFDANGTLGFSDVNNSNPGGMLANSFGQIIHNSAYASPLYLTNTVIGEIFNWTGSANALTAITIVDMSSAGGGTYQPFLFDLGTGIFNSSSNTFNPSAQINLFSAGDSFASPTFTSTNFLELNFFNSDQVTLQTGDSYAFGLVSTSANSDLIVGRSVGFQSDSNGDGFIAENLNASTDEPQPFSTDGVRNPFIGVYTVPEPTSITLVMMGVLTSAVFMRRRV